MSNFSNKTKGKTLLTACFALALLTCALLVVASAAEWQYGMCCVPAHADTPVFPEGADGSCDCVVTLNSAHEIISSSCGEGWVAVGSDPICSGVKWEDAKHGQCQTKNEKVCREDAATTIVQIRKGFLECKHPDSCTQNPDTCDCGLKFETNPETNDTTVPNCTGDGC